MGRDGGSLRATFFAGAGGAGLGEVGWGTGTAGALTLTGILGAAVATTAFRTGRYGFIQSLVTRVPANAPAPSIRKICSSFVRLPT